jgi:deoxyribonuclease-4
VCLDTCHVWDAGYDIHNIDQVLDEFDEIIGLNKLIVIHLNDSKNNKNSHKDRHANIGEGYLGLKTCQSINQNKRLQNINKILETPWVDGKPIYKHEISLLNKK